MWFSTNFLHGSMKCPPESLPEVVWGTFQSSTRGSRGELWPMSWSPCTYRAPVGIHPCGLKLIVCPTKQESKTRINPVLQSWLAGKNAGKKANRVHGSDTVAMWGSHKGRNLLLSSCMWEDGELHRLIHPVIDFWSVWTMHNAENTTFVIVILISHNNKVMLPTLIKASQVSPLPNKLTKETSRHET